MISWSEKTPTINRAKFLLNSTSGPVSISHLRHAHRGDVVWLIGSGKSLDFVPRTFFDDKIVVGVNATHRDWPVDYVFAHHREDAQEALKLGHIVVSSEFDQGRRENGENTYTGGAWFRYWHPQQPSTLVMNMQPMEKDDPCALVMGSNTVTSAIDFAGRILGAATVVLCGVDGGSYDGEWNYAGYNGGGPVDWLEQKTRGGTGLPHVRAQAPLLAQVIAGLTTRGVHVMSLKLEGHVFGA